MKHFLAFTGLMLVVTAAAARAEEEFESLVAPGEKVEKLAGEMTFTEGPAWIPAQKTLIFSDIPNTVDVKGNLYATQDGRIVIYTAHGKKREEIAVPESPANASFGGDDFQTLFITARTSLYRVRLKNPGAKPVGAKW